MKFTEEHVWLRDDDGEVEVGITIYAAAELGDIVFVELPEEGATVSVDDPVVVIEGADVSSDVLSPVDGEITEVNAALAANPGMINEDPQGDAWLFKIEVSEPDQLEDFMEEAGYQKYIR